jgi:hypothetical protein
MKRISLFAFLLLAAGFSACNNDSGTSKTEVKDSSLLSADMVSNPHSAGGIDPAKLAELPTMDFADTIHDFGNIKEGDIVFHEFEFTNNGKSPLIISDATGSCGCTVPTYPHDPIAPGKSGVLKVRFDSHGKSGHQEKTVTVKTNSTRGTHTLLIKAEAAAQKK